MFQQRQIESDQSQVAKKIRQDQRRRDQAMEKAETESYAGEMSLDELLADPMMPALWRAHGITEGDVRRAAADATARLKARGGFRTGLPSPRFQAAYA